MTLFPQRILRAPNVGTLTDHHLISVGIPLMTGCPPTTLKLSGIGHAGVQVIEDPSLSDVLREMARDGSVRTHSESCWQWHLPCAAMLAADLIEAYEVDVSDEVLIESIPTPMLIAELERRSAEND